jgi:hypothetical protein
MGAAAAVVGDGNADVAHRTADIGLEYQPVGRTVIDDGGCNTGIGVVDRLTDAGQRVVAAGDGDVHGRTAIDCDGQRSRVEGVGGGGVVGIAAQRVVLGELGDVQAVTARGSGAGGRGGEHRGVRNRGRLGGKRARIGQRGGGRLQGGQGALDRTKGGELGLEADFLGIQLGQRNPFQLHQLADDAVDVQP